MATARKKSTKKSPSKRKSAAAKTTNKRTTKKTAKAAPATPAKAVSRFDLLRRFHLFSAAVSVVIAVLAIALLSSQTVDLTATYSAPDPIVVTGEGQSTLGTAYETIFTVEFRYGVAALFVVAAVLSLLLATKLRHRYEAGIKNATSFYRWLFAGVVFGLLIELVTVLAGVQDLATLKTVVGLVIATTVLGYLAERDQKAGASHWGAYSLSLLTGLLAWMPAIVAMIGTHLYGLENYDWHVYALAVVVFFASVRFAAMQYRYIKYPTQHKDYVLVEEKYLSNEMFAKLAFAAIVFIALIK